MVPGVVFDIFTRLAGAILCAALALTLWNLTARSPMQVARDIVAGARNGRSFAYGLLRFAGGTFLAVVALGLVVSVLSIATLRLFSLFSIGAFISALAVEALIGDDLRRLLRIER